MNSYKDQLIHFGVPGMKWGHRKNQDEYRQFNRDQRQLRKQYREEYSRTGGKIGVGANRMNLNKTNYSIQRTDAALRKKYGGKKYNDYRHRPEKNALKAAGAMTGVAAAGLGALAVSSVLKSRNISFNLASKTKNLHSNAQNVLKQYKNLKNLL